MLKGAHSSVRILPPYPSSRPIRVRAAQHGMPLNEFLHFRMPYRSIEFWNERILAGKLTRKKEVLNTASILHQGEEIIHHIDAQMEPSVPDHIPIIFEDEQLLIVHKPAPLPMHPGGRYNKNSLHFILEERFKIPLYIVHRLDAVTTGLVAFAKSAPFAKSLSTKMQQEGVQKAYLAVCKLPETLPFNRWECTLPIARQESFVFQCGEGISNAKAAHTKFELLQRLDAEYGILKCIPITGRTHQIRLHCEAMGHSILGDSVYNGSDLTHPKKHRIQNQEIFLQSSELHWKELGYPFQLNVPEKWLDVTYRELFIPQNTL